MTQRKDAIDTGAPRVGGPEAQAGPPRTAEPLVAVVVPTIGRDTLKQTLDSIVLQTYTNLKCFVVTDGVHIVDLPSTAQDYFGGEARVSFLELDKSATYGYAGRAFVLNMLKDKAKYFSFCDDDDVLLPNKLTAQIGYLEERPDVDLVYGRVALADDQGFYGTYFLPFDGSLMRSTAYLVNNAWTARMRIWHDYPLDVNRSDWVQANWYNADWTWYLQLIDAGCRIVGVDQLVSCVHVSRTKSAAWPSSGFRPLQPSERRLLGV